MKTREKSTLPVGPYSWHVNNPSSHPIFRLKLCDSEKTWIDWYRAWKSPQSFEDRVALLIRVFSLRLGHSDSVKRICFMLGLADRYDDYIARQENIEHYWVLGLRNGSRFQLLDGLRKKAFTSLCEGFFKDLVPLLLPFDPIVFKRLVWFFRRREPRSWNSNLCPVSSKDLGRDGNGQHYLDLARSFASDFSLHAWDIQQWVKYWDNPPVGAEMERISNCCESHRMEILDLIYRVGKLNTITDDQYLPSNEVLDVLTVQTVRSVRIQPSSGNSRQSVSLEEAYANGSAIAGALILARIKVNAKQHAETLPMVENAFKD